MPGLGRKDLNYLDIFFLLPPGSFQIKQEKDLEPGGRRLRGKKLSASKDQRIEVLAQGMTCLWSTAANTSVVLGRRNWLLFHIEIQMTQEAIFGSWLLSSGSIWKGRKSYFSVRFPEFTCHDFQKKRKKGKVNDEKVAKTSAQRLSLLSSFSFSSFSQGNHHV